MANLTVVPEVAGALQYQGVNDPRWSAPQTLVWNEMYGLVVPLESGQTQPMPGQRPATALEVQNYFPTASYQRILTGGAGGEPQYFVVNAIYRQPCQTGSLLPSLPAQLRITPEEMDVLGPWLGLTRDSVCDAGGNILDANLADGTDHRYQTNYNWNDLQSVTELFYILENFQNVKNGKVENPRHWSTVFDDTRLQTLMDQVKARSQELHEEQPHKPDLGSWEEFALECRAGLAFFLPPAVAGAATWGAVKLFSRFMAKRAVVAGGAALVDGPIPVGDIVGGGMLLFSVGDFMWNYDEIADELELAPVKAESK